MPLSLSWGWEAVAPQEHGDIVMKAKKYRNQELLKYF